MGRPREHDESVGEALLDAAEVLLADGGPDAVAVRAVADSVGTTTRAVYSRFGSKAGLIRGLAARGYRLLAGYVRDMPETADPAADLVAVGLHGFRRFALTRPHLFRLTFERVPAGLTLDPVVGAASLAAYEALAARVARARAAGVVAGGSDVEVAFAFHALCLGMASGELSREPPPVGSHFWRVAREVDLEAVWRRALEAMLRGLAPVHSVRTSPPG